MNTDLAHPQRIGRLTPLADVLAAIAGIAPVAPCEIAVARAGNCVLASDVIADGALPPAPVALRDGWAVDSEATRDAGPYAPLMLQPPPQRLDAFVALPAGTDAVAPLDAVSALGGMMQIMAPVAPGEGVLQSGGEVDGGTVLLKSGSRLRASDLAVLTAASVASVRIRQPFIRIANTKPGDAILEATTAFLVQAAAFAGAKAEAVFDLNDALHRHDADATVVIGGTGAGCNDRSVTALARAGSVICHGIGLSPGETAAFGTVNGRPVLLMPGRIDAVLACWLVLGRTLVDRLSSAKECDDERDLPIPAMLARKVTSTIGLAEVVPLHRADGKVEPLASGFLSLQSLAHADGWMLVPAESEGFPAGAEVDVRPLP